MRGWWINEYIFNKTVQKSIKGIYWISFDFIIVILQMYYFNSVESVYRFIKISSLYVVVFLVWFWNIFFSYQNSTIFLNAWGINAVEINTRYFYNILHLVIFFRIYFSIWLQVYYEVSVQPVTERGSFSALCHY